MPPKNPFGRRGGAPGRPLISPTTGDRLLKTRWFKSRQRTRQWPYWPFQAGRTIFPVMSVRLLFGFAENQREQTERRRSSRRQ